ncbi:MAG: DUF1759 domain-containing protein, partial [Limnohabitans sp.]
FSTPTREQKKQEALSEARRAKKTSDMATKGGGKNPGITDAQRQQFADDARRAAEEKFHDLLDFIKDDDEVIAEIPDEDPILLAPIEPTDTAADIDQRNEHGRVNELKKIRTQLYRAITTLAKNLAVTTAEDASPEDAATWEEAARRSIETKCRLTGIFSELDTFKSYKVPKPDRKKYNEYKTRIDQNIDRLNRLQYSYNSTLQTMGGDLDMDDVRELGDSSSMQKLMMANYLDISRKVNKLFEKPDSKEADFRGIDKLKPSTFSGDESEYHYFKKTFELVVHNRHLTKTHLALYLKNYLTGNALKAVKCQTDAQIDEDTYEQMWAILDERYGGEYREEHYITEKFEKTKPLRDMSWKELEKMMDTFSTVYNYYQNADPLSLRNEHSLLLKMAKKKFSQTQSRFFFRYCEEKKVIENFKTMLDWLKYEYKVAQRSEREFSESAPPDRSR